MAKILVVDDQKNMCATLQILLEGAGHEASVASSAEMACQMVEQEHFDLVLTDLKMGRQSGLDLLRHTKQVAPLTEVIVMTAYGTIETAVEAMRMGAHDFVQKPFAEDEILVKVERAVEKQSLSAQISAMAAEFRDRYHFDHIIGESPAMREILGRVVRIAPTNATALITGESGTGKELIARAIHANSNRSDKPFISVNCAAFTETLLESELFGHAKGAFTGAIQTRKGLFEEANGGTFFFDEIAETPISFQAKLLRALQEGEIRRLGENQSFNVDVRIIAATNRDLKKEIQEKNFREDLYYRLNVVRFVLPSLRERREDIPLLAQHFLKKYNESLGRNARFGDGVLDFLMRYEYPGNIRELENLVEQGVALAVDGVIHIEDIMPHELRPSARPQTGEGETLQAVVDRAEKAAIEETLQRYEGNKEKAAEVLGLSATTLWRKMKRHGIVFP